MECCSIFSDEELLSIVGVTNAEGPPVPIPNTEVKLCSGEDTLRETVRENSSMLTRSWSGEIHSKDRNKTLLFREKVRQKASKKKGSRRYQLQTIYMGV